MIKSYLKKLIKESSFEVKRKSSYSQLGIPDHETKRLRQLSESRAKTPSSILFGKEVKITSPYWYLHSLEELFIEEVYKFRSNKREPIIVDCGANIGLSAIYFKRTHPHAKVIAFEPDKEIFEMLRFNLSQFGFTDVEIINKAIWKEDTVLQFEASGELGGKINSDGLSVTSNIIEIESFRLKKLLSQQIDFLKIDIEGAEFEVLKDCANELKNVELLFVEYHNEADKAEQDLPELLSILKNAGFRLYIREALDNLPYPFMFKDYQPFFDMQLNIFAYRN